MLSDLSLLSWRTSHFCTHNMKQISDNVGKDFLNLTSALKEKGNGCI